jgi:ATP-dependent DNA helicase RecG
MELEYAEVPNGFQVIVKYEEQKISTKKFTEKDTEKDTEKVTEKQKIIIDNIINNPNITTEELALILGINLRNTKNNIAKLKSRGILERIGADKGGYWKIIQ